MKANWKNQPMLNRAKQSAVTPARSCPPWCSGQCVCHKGYHLLSYPRPAGWGWSAMSQKKTVRVLMTLWPSAVWPEGNTAPTCLLPVAAQLLAGNQPAVLPLIQEKFSWSNSWLLWPLNPVANCTRVKGLTEMLCVFCQWRPEVCLMCFIVLNEFKQKTQKLWVVQQPQSLQTASVF